MLKRLLIAVFVLSLILAFSGTAFADTGKGPLEAVKKIDTNNPRLNDLAKAGPEQPATKKPASAIKHLPTQDLSAPIPPLDYFCDLQNYYGGLAYFWTIPDAYGDDLFNTRFTAEEGYDCELVAAHYIMYAPSTVGDPDMMAYLWADDGFGFPGALLDSVLITDAEIDAFYVAGGGSNLFYVSADFSAGGWTFSDGEEYHLGWTIIDNSGVGTDVLAIISDDGAGPYVGEERSSEYYGAWGTMLNDWGLDVVFAIDAERCCTEIPFSECYSIADIQNVAYVWRAPHPTYGDEAYSQRFDLMGGSQDTLVSVDVAIYDDGSGFCGNDDVIISLYEDDGAGLPGALINAVTVPAGTYGFYPAMTNVSFMETLGAGSYHVAFSSSAVFGSGDYEVALSSDGSDGVGHSASYWAGGPWVDMLNGWGLDCNFYYVANICRDQFAICSGQAHNVSVDYVWSLPDSYGDVGHAQKMKSSGQGCRVNEVAWAFYDNGTATYAGDVEISVYSDAGGLPGTILETITQNASTFALYPAMQSFDFEPYDVFVGQDFWVTVTSLAAAEDIVTMSDAGGGSMTDGWCEDWGAGNWHLMTDGWGVGPDWNSVSYAYTCCIPFGEYACNPGVDDDYNTWNGDYGRTNRSDIPTSDSWCDLTLDWSFEHPTAGFSFHGPTIYGDYVVIGGLDVRVFDLITGAPVYTWAPGIPYLSNVGNRNIVTIEYIDALGMDVMFLAGGDQQAVTAVELQTGTMIWSRNISTVGLAGLFGTVTYLPAVVLDIAGTQVVYWATADGFVVAADAVTGALYPGWATNPVALGADPYKSGSSDGTSLYFSTYPTISEGDLYSIDAATGVINWQLASAGGLQATTIFGAAYTGGDEGFMGGCAVDALTGTIYANSRATGDHPTDGVFYRINSADGSLVDGAATASNRSQTQGMVVDINTVYVPFTTRWVVAPAGGNSVLGFDRGNGTAVLAFNNPVGSRAYNADIVISCEPGGEADQLYVFDEDGFLICYNADDATPYWRRRIDNGAWPNSMGGSGAIAADSNNDTHILFASYYGQLFDLTKGVDRPRLQFYTYNPGVPVEFGSLASLPMDLGPILTNTGCADLVLTAVNVDDASNGATNPGFSIGSDLMDRTSSVADKLTGNSFDKLGAREDRMVDELYVRSENDALVNKSAGAWPGFLNSVDVPYTGQVVAPGEDVNLEIDVIQANILRGPQSFYIEFVTNDPDFFLNDPTKAPEIEVVLTGGCLIDTVTLEFGVGGANFQWATNTGRLGTGDWDPHGFDIDGDAGSYYQGSYFYGTSQYKVATHSQDWTSGGGEVDALISMQPDPNWCDGECRPALQAAQNVGAIWDGTNYVPMIGNIVCRSYLDSVQNTWDYGWDGFPQPFDNDSTMGLYVVGKTIGVLDVPEMANFTLDVMEITEQNGNAVPGWAMAHYFDCDLGGDLAAIHQEFSAGYATDGGKTSAWGSVKIPFGDCDGAPLHNVVGLHGDVAFWDWNMYWDSAYMYTQLPAGDQTWVDMHAGDEEIHITLDQHDFAANETYKIAIANFAVFDQTDSFEDTDGTIEALANIANKFAGFGRGDVDNSGAINLADIIYLAAYVNAGGPGPMPFEHLGDVNTDLAVDGLDIDFMIDYYFNCGPCPAGDWMF
ncbi:MAG: hypothetical protein DRP35_05875 [Candidatus Zixiibacteriota bacterium]|nr:MAG: hypothetical protein DRP35_05875 [candidate division Zixibacteria bacterium]